MVYIENMFEDAGIDANYDVETGFFRIKFKYGDEVDGFKYNRELCLYDCQNFFLEVVKIIESDIRLIKSEIRRVKLKELRL